MVWGCFQGEKLGPLAIFPKGHINAIKYCEMLEETFVPFWQDLDIGTLFMEDGAPVHTARYSQDWRERHGISSIEWPAQSPDLNPIENLWQQLKLAVEKRKSRNKEELVVALKDEWRKIEEGNYLSALINSMPRRVRAVIDSNGLPTKY
jgi:DDE superfamily endonuclease